MSCQNNCNETVCQSHNNGYIIIVVLYILLAIILGSFIVR